MLIEFEFTNVKSVGALYIYIEITHQRLIIFFRGWEDVSVSVYSWFSRPKTHMTLASVLADRPTRLICLPKLALFYGWCHRCVIYSRKFIYGLVILLFSYWIRFFYSQVIFYSQRWGELQLWMGDLPWSVVRALMHLVHAGFVAAKIPLHTRIILQRYAQSISIHRLYLIYPLFLRAVIIRRLTIRLRRPLIL